jgi:hypothetical protein
MGLGRQGDQKGKKGKKGNKKERKKRFEGEIFGPQTAPTKASTQRRLASAALET